AVDLGQLSHHRSNPSDFESPVATTTHPAIWFPENVTASPFSRGTVHKRTRRGIFILARGFCGAGGARLAARDRGAALQALRIPRLSRQAAHRFIRMALRLQRSGAARERPDAGFSVAVA